MEGLGLGRIVHYVTIDNEEYAAIVTEVCKFESFGEDESKVNLFVFTNSQWKDNEQLRDIPYDADKGKKTWHWCERV